LPQKFPGILVAIPVTVTLFACRWRKAVSHNVNGLIWIFICRLECIRFLLALLLQICKT